MLPDDFLRWWFAPWDLAAAHDATAVPADLLARRDGYRRWCKQAGMPAMLPAALDDRWTDLAFMPDAELAAAARLFGALFAVRLPQSHVLAGLTLEERRWCAGIASLQPLPRAPWRAATAVDAGLTATGLAWISLCLEQGFPGLWPRLHLRLPMALRVAVALCLDERVAVPGATDLARLPRCWTMCVQRVRATP